MAPVSHWNCTLLACCVISTGCSSQEHASNASQAASGGSTAVGTPPAAGSGGTAPTALPGSPPAVGNAGGVGGSSASIGSGGMSAQAGSGGAGGVDAGEMAHAGTDAGDSGAGAACEKGKVQASEVVFIGESFIAQTGAIPRLVTQHARDAGTIAMSESYRSFAVSGTQLTTNEIPMQYAGAKAESPVKVVLMDGGGNDLLLGSYCTNGPSSCDQIVMVVDTLFKQMGMDGVQDVVYFFYPDPMGVGANIKDAMDVLRPQMKQLCDATKDVRCIWVDQRESWDGHYDTFTSDGIHPTEEGATASAQQIWDAMVASCVAQ